MFQWITRLFQKKKTKDELILSTKQFTILQRLSGYFLYRQDELKEQFPEIYEELTNFYQEKGESWQWSPSISDMDKLSRWVETKPELFQIEGSVGGSEEGTLYYTPLSLGITTSDGEVLRRSQILAERMKEDEGSEEDFFDELSKI